MQINDVPILYSFRRCPYAMRARMAIVASAVVVELREVHLRDKPTQMLAASPKATVPVLVLANKTVIDESLDIMTWALEQNNSMYWLAGYSSEEQTKIYSLIEENDTSFKQHLDHYKYADRFTAYSAEYYREQGEAFLQKLNVRLQQTDYLFGESLSLADIAIFPFIRQFAQVDKNWFDESEYKYLQRWLENLLISENFKLSMKKFVAWQANDKTVFLNDL